jgi:hypothetical protein
MRWKPGSFAHQLWIKAAKPVRLEALVHDLPTSRHISARWQRWGLGACRISDGSRSALAQSIDQAVRIAASGRTSQGAVRIPITNFLSSDKFLPARLAITRSSALWTLAAILPSKLRARSPTQLFSSPWRTPMVMASSIFTRRTTPNSSTRAG